MAEVHRIRLRGPWEVQALSTPLEAPPAPTKMTLPCRWSEGGWSGFRGQVRHSRRFGCPTGIDHGEKLFLVLEGFSETASIILNGVKLAENVKDTVTIEITGLLNPRNEVQIDVEADSDQGGIWQEVYLEIRPVPEE